MKFLSSLRVRASTFNRQKLFSSIFLLIIRLWYYQIKLPKKPASRHKQKYETREYEKWFTKKAQDFIVGHYQTLHSVHFRFGGIFTKLLLCRKNTLSVVSLFISFYSVCITMYAFISGRSWFVVCFQPMQTKFFSPTGCNRYLHCL